MSKTNFYAVIMAGGLGGRLWPLSRRAKPKQLHTLISDQSMIRETFLRLEPKFAPDKIIISTTPNFVEDIRKHLPEIPAENYVIEPFPMGTAAACGLVTKILNLRDPKSSVVFLPADAYIKDKEKFIQVINYAEKVLEKNSDHIITLGITPRNPDTGMGYIQIKEQKEKNNELELWKVKRFVEKPDRKTAEEYIETKEYYWNGGIFVWKTDNMLQMIEENLPKTHSALLNIARAIGTDSEKKTIEKEYALVEPTTIDYGIMEKTDKILLIPADFGWSDVGSWETLHQVLSELRQENNILRANHAGIESEDCLILSNSDKLIATVGLKNIAIIDTPDALLVCNTKESHKVKELLQKLDEELL